MPKSLKRLLGPGSHRVDVPARILVNTGAMTSVPEQRHDPPRKTIYRLYGGPTCSPTVHVMDIDATHEPAAGPYLEVGTSSANGSWVSRYERTDQSFERPSDNAVVTIFAFVDAQPRTGKPVGEHY
jgi:hypothetical protein